MASNRKQRACRKTLCNSDPLTGELLQHGTPRMVVSDYSYSRLPSDRVPIPRVLHRHVSNRINYLCDDYLGSPVYSRLFSTYLDHTKALEELQYTYWYRVPYVVSCLMARALPVGQPAKKGQWTLDDLDNVLAWMRGDVLGTRDVYRLTKQRITIISYVRTHLLPFDHFVSDSATA